MNWELLWSKCKPSTVIDVGAHKGDWHNQARLGWLDAHFILIEAQEACRPFLEATGAEHHIAVLSDCEKEVTFYNRKDDISTGASIYRENTPFFSDEQIEPEIRRATTLEKIMEGRSHALPILLKIDAQGSELDIICGAGRILQDIDALVLEVAVFPYNAGAPLYDEVEEYVRSQGFKLEVVLGSITHPLQPELVIQQDVLYLRK